MGFSRQEYWSRLPFPSPGDLPHPGMVPTSPTLQMDSLPLEPSGKPKDVVLVQPLSRVQLFATLWLPCPSPSPRACSKSCPLSQWYHLTISSSVIPFSSCFQSFPASGSFSMSQFFTLGGQNIGVSASASVLPVNIQDWFPLGLTGLFYLLAKGLSRIFSNTTAQNINSLALSFHYTPTLTSIHVYWEKFSFE